MSINTNSGRMALARDLMDKALAAKSGVRVPFLDADYPTGAAGSKKDALQYRQNVYQARSRMRRVQARIENPLDVVAEAAARTAVDPEAARTAYDNLFVSIDRNNDDTGWIFTLAKADSRTLLAGLEEF